MCNMHVCVSAVSQSIHVIVFSHCAVAHFGSSAGAGAITIAPLLVFAIVCLFPRPPSLVIIVENISKVGNV